MSNVASKGTAQTIPLRCSNELGKSTPQRSIECMNLNSAMKSASPHTPSDLSRNNSDATSTTSLFQARKSVTNPCLIKTQIY